MMVGVFVPLFNHFTNKISDMFGVLYGRTFVSTQYFQYTAEIRFHSPHFYDANGNKWENLFSWY